MKVLSQDTAAVAAATQQLLHLEDETDADVSSFPLDYAGLEAVRQLRSKYDYAAAKLYEVHNAMIQVCVCVYVLRVHLHMCKYV